MQKKVVYNFYRQAAYDDEDMIQIRSCGWTFSYIRDFRSLEEFGKYVASVPAGMKIIISQERL